MLENNSILLAAAKIVPVSISGATAAIVTGYLVSRIQPGFIMLVSMTAFCVGTILLATNPVGRSYWAQLFVSTIVVTWGMVSESTLTLPMVANQSAGHVFPLKCDRTI